MSENYDLDLPNLPGTQLRQLRTLKGLTLKELADEAGTSPSAVHRYESGWGAFELRTLVRLAAALGARVEITLKPVPGPAAVSKPTGARLVAQLRPLFWDVDLTTAHLKQNPEWVLDRVLRFGDWGAVHHARLYFGDDAVRRASRRRSMDERTRRFWQVVLGPEEAQR